MTENLLQNIDPSIFFAYNRTMEKRTRTKGEWLRLALQIVLTAACVLAVAFIFSNSLKTGEESSEQSSSVVDLIQEVAAFFDPDSPIATATGEDYARLHSGVRTLAHFGEFALLGALFCGCCFSYTLKLPFQGIAGGGVALVPCIDETLQAFTAGRAADWRDILVDIAGGACGWLCVFACVLLGVWLFAKIRRKKSGGIPSKEC